MNCKTHHHDRPGFSELADRLRRKSLKLTVPRRVVLEVLCRSEHPISIREIFTTIPNRNCDLATVYRSLRALEAAGMVKRFDFGDGVSRFELLVEGDDGHHHHLICTRCSEVVEIEDCSMSPLEEQIAARNGFSSVTHKLEFFGICPACRERP